MNIIQKYAETLYNESLKLKKYDDFQLRFKRNRMQLINDLQVISALVSTLEEELLSDSSYFSNYYSLVFFMSKSLFESMSLLAEKKKNYRLSVCRYIHGFHNLPRAFLDDKHPMKISVESAMSYYRPYIKAD